MKKGTIKIIEDFFIPELNRKRTLRIYLPPQYEESAKSYPVIYMHDAQNLFDAATSAYGTIWDAASVLDDGYNAGKNEGIIIVGIDHGGELRLTEYSPWLNPDVNKWLSKEHFTALPSGEGFQYIEFIVRTLKPYIDSNYKTLPDRSSTAICGSSMGGFISMAAGIKYQEVFSKIGAFSSAMFFAEEDMKNLIIAEGKKYGMKIYMDIGTNETSNSSMADFPDIYMNANKNIFETLKSVGYSEQELKFVIDEGAVHNETAWNKRFPGMLDWIYS